MSKKNKDVPWVQPSVQKRESSRGLPKSFFLKVITFQNSHFYHSKANKCQYVTKCPNPFPNHLGVLKIVPRHFKVSLSCVEWLKSHIWVNNFFSGNTCHLLIHFTFSSILVVHKLVDLKGEYLNTCLFKQSVECYRNRVPFLSITYILNIDKYSQSASIW